MELDELSRAEQAHHLHRLRDARYQALRDAEDFLSICFALEELGCRLKENKANGLGGYETQFRALSTHGEMNPADFEVLFNQVRVARNDAAHQGVAARNAVKRAIKLCVYIEAILMSRLTLVGDVMSSGLLMAQPHHTLSYLREMMLGSSFSFLPYQFFSDYRLINDLYLSQLIRSPQYQRKAFYTTTVSQLDPKSITRLKKAVILKETDPLADVIDQISIYPAVVEGSGGIPVGIITAFDLL